MSGYSEGPEGLLNLIDICCPYQSTNEPEVIKVQDSPQTCRFLFNSFLIKILTLSSMYYCNQEAHIGFS